MMRRRLRAGHYVARGAEDHQRTSQLDSITAGEQVRADSLAVDKATVAAAQIDQRPTSIGPSIDARVVAGHLRVVQLDLIGRFAAQGRRYAQQLKVLTAVSTTNDKQRRHEGSLKFEVGSLKLERPVYCRRWRQVY